MAARKPVQVHKKARGPHRKRRRKHGRDMQLSKEMLLDVRPWKCSKGRQRRSTDGYCIKQRNAARRKKKK